jgi:hypothetical protein
MIRRLGIVTVVFVVLLGYLGGVPGGVRAANLVVNCTTGLPIATIQGAVNSACSNDTISVSGACNESVTINTQNAGCTGGAVAFTKLSLKGTSNTVNHFTGAGPAFLISGGARNISLSTFTVGADNGHGIEVAGAHLVDLSGIRTTAADQASQDGIHIDTASTRVRVRSSTLLENGGDGVEMGATYGEVTSVTANDNGAAGINVTGSNDSITRCKANETNGVGNAQQEGFLFSGPGAIVQQCSATDNIVAQFQDTSTSTGVIHYRNIAGTSSATDHTLAGGTGFLEEGSGNRINACTAVKNNGPGFDIEGDGNALQVSSSNSNVGSQLLIGGNNNFIQSNTFTRVSTTDFTSTEHAVQCPVGQANFFDRNRVSVASGSATGDGYTVDPSNNGSRNTRAPSDPDDPPAYLR